MQIKIKHIAAGTFIALLLIGVNVKAEGTEVIASNFESTLQIENWMIDETVWNTNSIFIEETETDLELEHWMTKTESWNFNISLVEEAETALEIEDWMICDKICHKNTTNDEPELNVECWMMNDNLWK